VSRILVNYEESEKFIADNRARGIDVSWDGWTMVFWKQNPNGFNDKNGAFKNGRWGVQSRISPNEAGQWGVPVKYVTIRRPRN
jgi:hypothetical protein